MKLDCTVIVGEQSDFTLQAVSSPAFRRKKHDAVLAKIMREVAEMPGYDRSGIYVDITESEAGINCICVGPSYCFTEMHQYVVVVAAESDDPLEDSKAWINTLDYDKMLKILSQVSEEDRLPEDLDKWEDITVSFYGGRKKDETDEEKRVSKIGSNYKIAFSDEEYFPEYWSVVRDRYMDTYSIITSELMMDKLWSHGQYEKILQIFQENQSDPVYACYAGDVMFSGFVGAPDYAKACEYYRFAVYRGCVRGFYNLAIMYRDGLGVEKDYNEYKRILLQGYNAVMECGKQCLPVIADVMLELSRAGQACGKTKDAIKAVSLAVDGNECVWTQGAEVSETDIKCVEQLYSLKSFSRSKRRLADFLYVLREPCKVCFRIHGMEHTAEAVASGEEVVVAYEGQYYKDAADFMNRAEIDGNPIRTYAKELQKMEVIA
ncbi:MAG: hypothetical protein LUD50_06650 [Clostridia bacterium]|nr:hypothetical protein [Clostridia bacterium]